MSEAGGTRLGDWQLTASGRVFWPLDPHPEEIDIEDIAHHLGRICRWGGAVRHHYSVAEHCVLLANWLLDHAEDEDLARWALMHDAAEAYLGDIVRPLKPYFQEAARFETLLETMIWRKYGLAGAVPDLVRRLDTAILGDERDQLFGPGSEHSRRKRDGESGLGIVLPQWERGRASAEFLTLFDTLFPEHRR